MATGNRMAALNKFRGGGSTVRGGATRVLVVYDVQVKAPDVFQIPLVINYGELPLALSSQFRLTIMYCRLAKGR